ncbi:hypothetical protein BO94DRAFT_580105 [Aspergillus sclerotioniger CBS 115572]|uniref:Zn(2)-C6 fungal-type domain-containing protein n=1 Tax=Aspergillus sclerotioniger CBS 115572 TaxID=1450535 RepID=A0A317XEL9_9EURO|nr:hypothetical protein BO94DRAFT_580105 [Aspergillus sclerotioniger CBS 115572]PWY96242.1 hypothetical protein BO94DRAFT_580105 [Aspergillus sclerotioniger CBS 115572]
MTEIRPSKSRNGCATCKARKVKCDEQKPVCLRCKSTGRRCGGYNAANSLRIIQHVPIGKTLQQVGQLTKNEQTSVEFFQRYTIPSFGADLGACLLPAASSDPIIHSVAIAVGCMHRSFTFPSTGGDNGSQFALRYYNKAIRELVLGGWHNSVRTSNTVLMACVLFFCCESLQGRYKAALQHAASGLRIIQQQQALSHASPKRAPAAIGRLFHTLESQILEIEGPVTIGADILSSEDTYTARDMIRTTANSDGIQHSFEILYNKLMRLDAIAEILEAPLKDGMPQNTPPASMLESELMKIRLDMQGWMIRFDQWNAMVFGNQQHSPKTSTTYDSIMILNTWRVLISMYLRMDWPPSEMCWDRFTADFIHLLSFASAILNPHGSTYSFGHHPSPASLTPQNDLGVVLPPLLPKPSNAVNSTFSLSLGIITPLYICATRCRDSKIRYRALSFLFCCRRREGLWDSDLAARVAQEYITIEENAAGITPGVSYQVAEIGRECRVRSLSPRFEEGRQASIRCIVDGQVDCEMRKIFTW